MKTQIEFLNRIVGMHIYICIMYVCNDQIQHNLYKLN